MIAALMLGLARYKLLLEILIIGALALGAVAGIHHFLEHEREIGRQEVRAEWDKQIAKDKEAADKQERDWRNQRETAATEGAKREETIRSLAATSAAAANGLRNAIAKINSTVPDYSADALRALTSTYGQLLEECSGRRRTVAEEAERLNSEKRTLIEAWPQGPSKPRSSTP